MLGFKPALVSTFLGAAFLVSAYFIFHHQYPTLSTSLDSEHPHSFSKDLKSIRFDEKGQPHEELEASSLTYFSRGNTSILKNSHYTIHGKYGDTWEIWAPKAIQQENTIHLWGKVLIKHLPSDTSSLITIRTKELFFYPKEQLATTQKLITLEESGVKVSGYGMRAYLKEKRIQLLSKAQGSYTNHT